MIESWKNIAHTMNSNTRSHAHNSNFVHVHKIDHLNKTKQCKQMIFLELFFEENWL